MYHIFLKELYLHCKEVTRTDKEEVPDHVGNHLLVEEPVLHLLPVSVLGICNSIDRYMVRYI